MSAITGMCLTDEDVDAAVINLRVSAERITELEDALRSVIARVRSAGGYATPEQQDVLFHAERVLAGGTK